MCHALDIKTWRGWKGTNKDLLKMVPELSQTTSHMLIKTVIIISVSLLNFFVLLLVIAVQF